MSDQMTPNDEEDLSCFDSEYSEHGETASAAVENIEDAVENIEDNTRNLTYREYVQVDGSIAENVAPIKTEEQSIGDNVDTLAVASSIQTESIEVLDAQVTSVKNDPLEPQVSCGT